MQTERPIILLDLNYTLADNSSQVITKGRFYDIGREEYRSWLRDLIADHYVILITVRPEKYKAETMARIQSRIDWQPHEAYFNEWSLRAPQCKTRIIEQYVFPNHGRPDATWYLALESNDDTAAMYRSYGIQRHRARDVEAAPGLLTQRSFGSARLF